jgi:hypothetical protein
VARQMVLRRAVRGAGVEGAVGRADGNLDAKLQDLRENHFYSKSQKH